MNLGKREYILTATILVLAAFLVTGISQEKDGTDTDWREVQLEDVNTGESFTIDGMEKPVLVETFAVWCTTCTRQQQEIKKLHESSNVTSVSLNVDVNEGGDKIREHTERYGFDWHYAVAPPEMTRSLVDEYDNSIRHPPSAPAILVCENSTRRLPNGVKPVSELQEEIERGC